MTRDNRAPLTKSVLEAVFKQLPQVCLNDYETKLFSSLFTLAYFGLFRVSELVTSFKQQKVGPIERSDVSIVGNKYAVIKLRHFKTHQKGKPVLLKIPEDSSPVCPVRAMSQFLSVRPHNQGIFFSHLNNNPVTKTQFNAVLTKCINKCHLSGNFKSHSFRIGRATDLAVQGHSSKVIMKLGRWSSDCYKLYIRP